MASWIKIPGGNYLRETTIGEISIAPDLSHATIRARRLHVVRTAEAPNIITNLLDYMTNGATTPIVDMTTGAAGPQPPPVPLESN